MLEFKLAMTNFIDISRPIYSGMVVYPNNPEVNFMQVQKAGEGKNALTRIELGTHTGTHIDSPAHIHDGAEGVSVYEMNQLNGEAEVVDLSQLESVITDSDMPKTETERVLFKTRNSAGDQDEFDDNFVALDDSAAQECVKRGVKLVGLDALSIRKRGTVNKVHEILIDAGIVVLEGLWLAGVEAGGYELVCMPLKIDSDGAPVRAVLKKMDD